MRNTKSLMIIITSMFLVSPGSAHVHLHYPVGGEIFTRGDTILIEWERQVPHTQNNWDLLYSSDGGVNWITLRADLSVSQLSYQWIINEPATDLAQIKIIQDNVGGNYEDTSGNFSILNATTDVKSDGQTVNNFTLSPNYPNPFNPITTIEYGLPVASYVSLTIYDFSGREVITLVNRHQNPGWYRRQWDGRNQSGEVVATGVYLARIKAGEYSELIKMTFIK